MSRRIDYLQTITSLPGETGMVRIISTCGPSWIWLILMAFHFFCRKGIRFVTILEDVYLLSRISVICAISTV